MEEEREESKNLRGGIEQREIGKKVVTARGIGERELSKVGEEYKCKTEERGVRKSLLLFIYYKLLSLVLERFNFIHH